MSEAALPRAHGEAVLSATIRTSPEAFFVEEIDAFAASGAGEHLLLATAKRGMNTPLAAKLLAQWAGVGEQAIGHAGLKAPPPLTLQPCSVTLPGPNTPPLATGSPPSRN